MTNASREWFRPGLASLEGYAPGEQPSDRAGGIVKLNTNENPYPPPASVLAALTRDARLHLYPPPGQDEPRREAAAALGLSPDRIVFGVGSDELLSLLFSATLSPGDRVSAPYPSYGMYPVLARAAGAAIVEAELEDDFSLPASFPDPEARLAVLANPNSPTGICESPARIAQAARASRGLLVVDEAYADFSDTNALGLLDAHPNLVIVRTLSKSFSLAGLRVGFAIGHPEVISVLHRLRLPYNLGRPVQAAAAAAFREIGAMRENARRIRVTRERLAEGLRALGAAVVPSGANFVLAGFGDGASGMARELAARGILVRHFPRRRLEGYLRITVGRDDEADVLLAALGDLMSARGKGPATPPGGRRHTGERP